MTDMLRRVPALFWTVSLCVMLAACARGDAETRLRTIPLAIVTADGARHAYVVEVAETPDDQARGLMYRKRLTSGGGMLFPFQPPRPASFWMMNTYIPLDMIFVLPDRRIESILSDVPPHTEDQRRSLGRVAAVLELNAGEAARIGAKPGDRVEYDLATTP